MSLFIIQQESQKKKPIIVKAISIEKGKVSSPSNLRIIPNFLPHNLNHGGYILSDTKRNSYRYRLDIAPGANDTLALKHCRPSTMKIILEKGNRTHNKGWRVFWVWRIRIILSIADIP